MIKAVIVEDELQQRVALKEILKMTCPDVVIIAEAEDIKSGIEIIKDHKPQLVFMDIQLRNGLSFEILENDEIQSIMDDVGFHVIFLTAFNQYAIKAIRYSALDYLLKPIDPDELLRAVDRFKKQMHIKPEKTQYEMLFANLKPGNDVAKKLVINAADRINIVKIENIVRCESKDNYTLIFMKDASPILVSRTLKEYEEILEPNGFLRIHQSHLVNLDYVKTFLKTDGGYVVMDNEDTIPVSHRKKDRLLEIFRSM